MALRRITLRDFVIVRENTECLYVKQERVEEEGARVVASRVITRRARRAVSTTSNRGHGRCCCAAIATDRASISRLWSRCWVG